MRILIGQISPIIGDIDGNLRLCLEAVSAARRHQCGLVLLPEMALSGYQPRDLLHQGGFVAACMAAAERLIAASAGLTVVFGLPLRDDRGLRNAAIVAHDGRARATIHKRLLPTYDIFDEDRYFLPGEGPQPVVTIDGVRLGITICEDLWNHPTLLPELPPYPADPAADLAGRCDVLLNLSASPFHRHKVTLRRALMQAKAAQVGVPLLYANMVGGNDELLFDGRSLVIRPDGALLHEGPAFEAAHLIVDLDRDAPRPVPALQPEAEVAAALRMGIRDYAARCGFRGALLGLSGGIDSALVAALAVQALGPENVLTIGMPGPYSSDGSITDARALADALGCAFEVLPIGDIHTAFLGTLAPVFAGRAADVTEENLQSRARGSLLMAVSNKLGHLLLTTGNKSELSVGYCTLYGDMNGGLSVIGDLFKTEVYALSRHLNRDGEVIPQATLDKPPSAELAPDQRDSDSLPPYDVLDAVLRLLVEERRAQDEVIAAGFDAALVRRVAGLLARSEYKRWQTAPVLRVTPKAFGTGRRIPLAQRWR